MDKRYCETKTIAELMAEQIRLINENLEKHRMEQIKKLEKEHKQMRYEIQKQGYAAE